MAYRYLSAEDIFLIHARIIEATGGSDGVRDIHRIESMIQRPAQAMLGTESYPDAFSKAAVYFEISSLHHPFIDGNKRSAFILAAAFLELNGYEVNVSQEGLEKFVLDCVAHKYPIEKIAAWFKKHSAVLKN